MLSKGIADARRATVGDRVTLPTPVPTPLRIAAISTNLGWSPGTILLNPTTTPAHGGATMRARSTSTSLPARRPTS
ncbi:MAG: hypothetical protein WD993_07895 [Thermoleophilaceae bacterium]